MTWRIFDSLVRRYCKADQSTPKPVTFREFCNTRLLQIMAVLDGIDDPRYGRSHVLLNPWSNMYLSYVGSIDPAQNRIELALQPWDWTPGALLYGINEVAGVYSSFVARVRIKAGAVYTVEILSGALIDHTALTNLMIFSNLPFGAATAWDSHFLRLRAVRGFQDYPVNAGESARRVHHGFERFEIFRELHKDYAMDDEIGWYNRGGVYEMTPGVSALPIAVPELEFDCMPSLYTEQTLNNTIELLPEHMRMLFDGVAAQVFTVLPGKTVPEDLKARIRDDMVRFYNARSEEQGRKTVSESKVSV